MLPILNKDSLLSLILSNLLNFIGSSYYWYITSRGYASKCETWIFILIIVLPFLKRQQYFKLPIVFLAGYFLLITALGIN